MTNRHHELGAMLRTLNLSRMAATFEEVAVRAVREGRSHEAFLHELARLECEHRTTRRIERRTRASGLPLDKTFRTLQLAPFGAVLAQQIERLRSGAFVGQAVNVIAVGRPGTGKSHVAAAVGHELIGGGHTVLWSSTAVLVQRLLAAKRDLRLPQALAKLDRFACLILDDIGYVQQSRDEMEVVFTLLAERYERRSVILTTNLAFSDWNRIFKDPMTTMAVIDRVVHHSVILDMMGLASYRAKEAHAQQTQPNGRPAAASSPATTNTSN
jgi:DNA replication protein DnaC